MLIGRSEMRGKAQPAEVILEPNLLRCIETMAREEFRRGVQMLAAGEGNEALAERSEILRLFLEGADFKFKVGFRPQVEDLCRYFTDQFAASDDPTGVNLEGFHRLDLIFATVVDNPVVRSQFW